MPGLRATSASRFIGAEVLLPPTSLHVHPGQCLAVLGENGAGKTTLLRILAGKLRATSGSVTIGDLPVDERAPGIRRQLASLIGVPAFYPDLTLGEHLALINATWGMAAQPSEQAVGLSLERFGLTRLRDRFPHELSSGQAQMFHLACVFCRPFTVLILDEPEQRLDPGRKEQLAAAIQNACGDGAMVILAAHDRALVDRLATHVIELV